MALSSKFSSSGLEVWFKDDIENALRAIDSANEDLFKTINTTDMQLYRQGYQAAIGAIAKAFGIRYRPSAHHCEETPTIIDVTSIDTTPF